MGLALWGSLAGAFSPGPAEPPAPEGPPVVKEQVSAGDVAQRGSARVDYRRLDARLNQLIGEDAMVGLAVAVVENGEIRFIKGYGETFAGGDPVTGNTVFRWASLSKGVAADMVAKLAEDGKVSLYAPVGRYSASIRLPNGGERVATVSDLLSHRLGIFSHAEDSKLEDGVDPKLLRGSLSTLNAICAPGQCHAYQNVAYDAASEIVEKATGRPYAETVRERLFAPLGMSSATLTRDGLVGARSWARPHRGGKNSRAVEVTDFYYRVPAAGGVNSSVKDLAIWMQAQMGVHPDTLSAGALGLVQSPRASTPGQTRRLGRFRERIKQTSYGLGWRIYDYAGHRVVGHHGAVTGYRSLALFDPQLKSGVVALWNSSAGKPTGLEYEVMDMIYGLPAKDWLRLGSEAPAAGEAEANEA